MGSDVDFFDLEGVADPRLIAAFRAFAPPLRDPEAFARILDRRCGHFLSFRQGNNLGSYAARRRRVRDKMKKMKILAADILSEGDEKSDVFEFSHALNDVLPDHVNFEQRQHLVPKLIAAVSLFSDLPLRKNLTVPRTHHPAPLWRVGCKEERVRQGILPVRCQSDHVSPTRAIPVEQ